MVWAVFGSSMFAYSSRPLCLARPQGRVTNAEAISEFKMKIRVRSIVSWRISPHHLTDVEYAGMILGFEGKKGFHEALRRVITSDAR